MGDIICAACNETVPEAEHCAQCGQPPLLGGEYRLRSVVGRGGVGITFRAEHVERGELVAIKEMPFRATDAESVRKLIEREARVLRQLEHPAIPRYHADFLVGHGRQRAFYLVQEFVEGRDLADELDNRRYTTDDVLGLIDELCDVLAYLHALHPPVIHRDIKPRNVMRRPDGRLVLLDFGAVRDVVNDPRMGGSTIAGTFGYMAPEQFTGQASAATDFYALGVLAVVLLSRRQPDEMMDVHTLKWRPHVQVPAPVEALLAWLLAPNPKARAADAAEVKRRVARVRAQLAGESPASEVSARSLPGPRMVVTEPTRATPGASMSSGGGEYWASSRAAPEARTEFHYQEVSTHAMSLAPLPAAARAKTKQMSMLLALFAGSVGAPWWYLGHKFIGLVSLLFFWSGVPWVISVGKALHVNLMSDEAFDQRYNAEALALHQHAQSLQLPERLAQLQALRERGALTDEEFDRQKRRLLEP